MMKLNLSIFALLSVLVASTALLAGCGDPEVQKADLEKLAMKQLTATVGKECPQVTCPGNLAAKVGATMNCSMPLDGTPHDVAVKVTSVEGSTAHFDFEVK
jgi:ABC-type uncharacterized transport system auxiliary subunit